MGTPGAVKCRPRSRCGALGRRWHAGDHRPRARVVSSGPAAACHSGGRQRGWGWIAPGGVLACGPPPPLRLEAIPAGGAVAKLTQHAESPQEPLRAQVESARSRRKRSRGRQGGGAPWRCDGGEVVEGAVASENVHTAERAHRRFKCRDQNLMAENAHIVKNQTRPFRSIALQQPPHVDAAAPTQPRYGPGAAAAAS